MPIQLNRNQIKDSAINVDKLDLSTGTFDFAASTLRAATPSGDNDVAIKSYVDNLTLGLSWKDSVRLATLANLNGTYVNGTAGVGATLTVGGGISLDDVTMVAGDRILLKNQTDAFENGIYSMTTNGNALAPSAELIVSAFANVTSAGKGNNAITITNAGNLTADSSTITLKDFDGNDVIMTAKASGATGQQFNIGTGGSANDDTATNLANALNGLTGGGERLFQAIASGAVVTVFFAQTGPHSGTLTNVTNASTAVSFSNSGVITAGTNGDTFQFTKANDSTVTFKAVGNTPGALDGQFVAISSDEQTALNLATAINADPDFSAAIVNDVPDRVKVSLATTGTAGNGKAITISVTNSGCIAQVGGSGFSGGQALGGNSILTRTTDFDIGSDITSAAVFVQEGTQNGDQGYVCTTDQPIQIGITDLTFVQFSGAGSIIAGNGLSKSGNTLSVQADGSTLAVSSSGVKVADGGIANAQISNSAAIAYSKLSLTGSILNDDLAGSISDAKLSTITSANKVSGSAIQLGSNGGLENDSGLKINLDGSSLALGASGISIAASGVSTAAIADSAVSLAKIQDVAANSLLVRNANSSGALTELAIADTQIMIGDGTGMVAAALSGDVTMANDGEVTIGASKISTAKIVDSAVTSAKLASGAVALAKAGFRPYQETFTANGSTSAFALSNDITVANWLNGAVVSRNGQILKKVASSPSDDSEYTIVSNSGTTTVTLGANPTSGELIQVTYFAD